MMNMNGMGGFGFGFPPNQGNFNGMGWNGMNPMSSMGNMMPNGNWNSMNPMGKQILPARDIVYCTSSDHTCRIQHDEHHEWHAQYAQQHVQRFRWKHGHGRDE